MGCAVHGYRLFDRSQRNICALDCFSWIDGADSLLRLLIQASLETSKIITDDSKSELQIAIDLPPDLEPNLLRLMQIIAWCAGWLQIPPAFCD